MAKNQSRNEGKSRRNSEVDMDENMEMNDLDIQDASRSTKRGAKSARSNVPANSEAGPQDLLASVTPALQSVQRYIEGSPLRAAAIGAIAGGTLMSIFATEKGRAFARMAYDYANPMVSKYVREYVSKAAGDMADNALSQH